MKNAIKKSLSVFLALTIIFSSAYVGLGEIDFSGFFAVKAKAAESGKCGENLTWTLSDDGTLTISGTGDMYKFSNFDRSKAPWFYVETGSVRKVVVEPGVTSIGEYAFYKCNSLTTVTISEGVTSIGHGAFAFCLGLKSITIPDSVTAIDEWAFTWCERLTSITIPDGVTSIGEETFSNCKSLTAITIPDSVTSIGEKAFEYCENLLSVAIGNGVTSVGDSAFMFCTSLTSVSFGENLRELGAKSFYYCKSLKSIELSDGLINIGPEAFSGCSALTSLIIPVSVRYIDYDAFLNCSSLKYVFYSGAQSDWNAISIDSGNVKLIDAYIHYNSSDHTYSSEWTTDVEPTCTQEGSQSHHCTVCDAKTNITNIEATGHTEVKDAAVEATCTKAGKTEGSHCSVCKEVIKAQTTVAKTGHTSSDWIIDKAATVDAAGSKHKECTECGEILETAKIPQLKCAKPKLKTIANTADGVKITWNKVSGADSYAVYRKTGSKGKYSKLTTTTKTGYTDKSAKSGKKYYYIVKAVNEAGSSSASSSKSIYYLADTTLKTPKSTKSGVTLNWTQIIGADGYMVYRKTGSGDYKKIATVKGVKKVKYTDKSAKKGKTYTYKIKAYKSKTYSAYSNAKKIKDKY